MFNFKEIMKAKLKRSKTQYILCVEEESINRFKSSLDTTYGWVVADEYGGDILKLSKQNCDSLFGVIDVEKLADDYFKSTNENSVLWRRIDYKAGFNKAMELNKDKVFTREDIEEAFAYGQLNQVHNQKYFSGSKTYIQSLQQPTEIDVEIEMGTKNKGFTPSRAVEEIQVPKLDSEGCLILKKL
jgi:hypothetical protein